MNSVTFGMKDGPVSPLGWCAVSDQRVSDQRMFRDSHGLEWEVFDEGAWNAALALAWDHPVQRDNPGLLFISSADMRRLWPRPADWRSLSDAALEELCGRAASVH